jgi:hypothetical protein
MASVDDGLLDLLHEIVDFAGSEPNRVRLHESVEGLRGGSAGAPDEGQPAGDEPAAPGDPDVSYTGDQPS